MNAILLAFYAISVIAQRTTCVIQPLRNGSDDAPAIIDAFDKCGHGGHVVFLNTTYNVKSVMNTTGLYDCQIDLHGTLLWDTNITYWLNNSLPVGYQNQTSAWFFGGRNVVFNGFGYGTLDGNGQVWYDFVNGVSNYPNRPHALTIWETYDSLFDGLRFVQSQMWTMTVKNSKNVLLQDIYVNNTSSSKAPARNTDGANTMFSDRITFSRWTIDNGDDSIAIKANSSNILIQGGNFYTGLGVAIGSIGQYNGVYEHVNNVLAEGINFFGTKYVGYIKTWTGVTKGYPPNGGGGGLGEMSNIVFRDFTLQNVTTSVLDVGQCTSFSGQTGDCDTSRFQISNVSWVNMTGSLATNRVGRLQCSAAAPCQDITIEGLGIVDTVTGIAPTTYLCSNVNGITGFECTGSA